MTKSETAIKLSEGEIIQIVYALMKASAYENEYWRALAAKSAESYSDNSKKEQCLSFIENARYFQREYTVLVQKICRCRAKKQGGIYRASTMSLMRSAVRYMQKDTNESVEQLRKAAFGDET